MDVPRILCLALFCLLAGCSSMTLWRSTNDFNSTREYGVVVSQRQGQELGSAVSRMFGKMFGSGQPEEENPISKIEYVIAKDNGDKVTVVQVPEQDDPIFYPGQRVMIVSNDGYERVVPPDPEYKREPRAEP